MSYTKSYYWDEIVALEEKDNESYKQLTKEQEEMEKDPAYIEWLKSLDYLVEHMV
jgi:hypothetical protein